MYASAGRPAYVARQSSTTHGRTASSLLANQPVSALMGETPPPQSVLSVGSTHTRGTSQTAVTNDHNPSSSQHHTSSTPKISFSRVSEPSSYGATPELLNQVRHTHASLLGHVHRSFLLNRYGEKVPISSLKGKVVALYFTAAWSLPSRVFTSHLSRIYLELSSQPTHAPFEVVVVSFDHAPPSHHGAANTGSGVSLPPSSSAAGVSGHAPTFTDPPLRTDVAASLIDVGLHLPEEDRHTRRKLVKLFQIKRIPSLVLLDGTCKVVSTKGVPLLTQRGSGGYPWRMDPVVDTEAKRTFEAEVVEIFAHLDRKQRVQIDAADLEFALLAGGTLPAAAVRACASQMLSDIASPSLHEAGLASSSSASPSSLSLGSGSLSGLVSLPEWKNFFLRSATNHGAEYPLSGLRAMLGLPEKKVASVPHQEPLQNIPALYVALEQEAKEKDRATTTAQAHVRSLNTSSSRPHSRQEEKQQSSSTSGHATAVHAIHSGSHAPSSHAPSRANSSLASRSATGTGGTPSPAASPRASSGGGSSRSSHRSSTMHSSQHDEGDVLPNSPDVSPRRRG